MSKAKTINSVKQMRKAINRKLSKPTQLAISRHTGLSPAYVNMILSGKRGKNSPERVRQVLDAIGEVAEGMAR
jgi:transcriptional regulator with XRE-family HTH domain